MCSLHNSSSPGSKDIVERLVIHTGGVTMKFFVCILGLLLIIPGIASAGGTWVDTTFVPPSLGVEKDVVIYLPEGYDPGGTIDYSVIYWLHGWGGSHTSYIAYTQNSLDSLISSEQIQPVIVVKPNGWCEPYEGSMWVNSELYGDYEDYVVFDLVDFVESSFCAISDPDFRCIAGHSMGAMGSMHLALSHTDRYKAVASNAGFQDIEVSLSLFLPEVLNECPETVPPYTYDWGNGLYTNATFLTSGAFSPNLSAPDSVDFILDENGAIIDSVFALWELFYPAHMVKEMSLPIDLDIFFDCGTDDGWIGCYESNCGYADTLTDLGIDHEFQSLTGIGHGMNLSRFIEEFLFLDEAMTGIAEGSLMPASLLLEPAFPNPFTTSTSLRFELCEPGHATLKVFDLSGRLVTTLIDGELQEGHHSVEFNAEDLHPGVYMYRLHTGSTVQTRRCMVLR